MASAAQCTSIFLAVSQYGFGSRGEDAIASEKEGSLKVRQVVDTSLNGQLKTTQALYASDILYIVSIGLSRCSTAFFLSSLTRDNRQKIIGVVIATLAATWAVASVFVVALRGDQSHPWLTLEPPVSQTTPQMNEDHG